MNEREEREEREENTGTAIPCSRWNDPKAYSYTGGRLLLQERQEELLDSPFAARPEETIIHTFPRCRHMTEEKLQDILGDADHVILEATAFARSLTLYQLYQYVNLRGTDLSMGQLKRRVQRLLRLRVLQENRIAGPQGSCGCELPYYKIDYWGWRLARRAGMVFHRGNQYLSYTRRRELGMPEEELPSDVKRILMGNQILLGLLQRNVKMKRFSVMETFRMNGRREEWKEEWKSSIIRTTVNVTFHRKAIYAYEVIRDTKGEEGGEPDALEVLCGKVERWYALLDTPEYLRENARGDLSFPQLVLCGESAAHCRRMADCLRGSGLLREETPVLFTEDSLYFGNTGEEQAGPTTYELNERNEKIWRPLPEAEA